MNKLAKLTLALMAAAFVSSTPVMAADTGAVPQKPELGATLKDKAANMVDQAKQKVDNAADNISKALGAKKDEATAAATEKGEIIDITTDKETVVTPDGVVQDSTTVIAPEGQITAPDANAAQAIPETQTQTEPAK